MNGNNSENKKVEIVSIVLPMYNNYEYVNLCLDSIIKAKTNLPYKIYVLDDQSQENESEKVKNLCLFITEDKNKHIHFIRNEKNLGFAANVNQGIKLSLADNSISHICIINSDTIVTDYWIDDLVSFSHKALVSPVSNSVGNEQIIRVPYENNGPCGHTRQSAIEFATSWRTDHIGNIVNSKMLGFFCILASRELYETVGLLDESFGRGYYEDDDYCHRILEKNFELKIVRQCFVHHFGSITFNSLQNVSISDLFKKNLEVFKKKHNTLPVDQTHSWIKAITLELEWQYLKNKKMDTVIKDWFVPKSTPPVNHDISDRLIDAFNQYIISKYGKFPIASAIMRRVFEIIIGSSHKRKVALKKFKSFIHKRFIPKLTVNRISLNNKKNIYFIFSTQNYYGRHQRPQHIAKQLSQHNNIVVWIDPEFGKRNSTLNNLTLIANDFYILNIPGIDYSNFYTTGITKAESFIINNTINNLLPSKLGIINKVKFFIQSPFWAELACNNQFEVIYDCMDLQEGFSTSTLEISYLEQKLITNANKIITSSEYLANFILNHFTKTNKKLPITVVKNGCDPEHFYKTTNGNEKTYNETVKTVGYFGAIADWFNAELVYKTAELLPDINFELIGEVTNTFIKENNRPKNLILLGEKPYKDLPKLTEHWNCAIIPFKINELILATNPVKLYEYSALGFPVITTSIPEVLSSNLKTYTADTPEDFSEQIRKSLMENSEVLKTERLEFAKQNSWKNRAINILQFIDNHE